MTTSDHNPFLARALDRLLPPLDERSPHERTRARALVMSSLGVVSLGLVSITSGLRGGGLPPVEAIAMAFGFATVPAFFRVTRSYRGAAWLFVVLAMALAVVALPRVGGMGAVYVLWLPMLPALVLVLLDYRAAVASVGFVLALSTVLVSAHQRGMIPPPSPPITPGSVAPVVIFSSLFFLAVSYARERAFEETRARHVEQERAAARAEAASRAKSSILASVSHELRTPMTGILGLSDLLADTELDPKQRDWIRTIHKTGGALLALLDDLLDTARLDAGRLVLERRPFRPVALAEQVLALFRPRARAKRIAIDLEVSAGVPHKVEGDPARVRQVLTNLVGNAIKFTESGRIVLRVSHDGQALVWEVADTGIGIASDRLEDIFAPFVRGAVTDDETGGVGLGLSIARLLVEAMRGEIAVRSELGVGTSFRVRLPLPVVDDDVPTTEATSPVLAAGRLRVLVAEDNPVNRMVLTAMLESLGHEVRVAHDGGEVLPVARRFQPDVVLMDLRMPVLDGLGATRRLRQEPSFEQVRIIALTANAFEEDRRACFDAGMDAFLAKPVTRAQLQVALVGPDVADLARASGIPVESDPTVRVARRARLADAGPADV